MKSSFQLMIAYDKFYYVKFTALSIKTICRALSLYSRTSSVVLYSSVLCHLSLLVLKILAVHWDPRY